MIGHRGVLDHGHVELLKVCAEDLDVVNAARVSLHQFSETLNEKDAGLIRFLMRERHGTPFEHGYFKFRIKAPIFVFREWHRHRVGHSYNEWSARYSKLEPEFYFPEDLTTQIGKPGAYTYEPIDNVHTVRSAKEQIIQSQKNAYKTYEDLLEKGVAKQQARIVLPVSTYSEMIWSCNPRSIMHFLSLRDDKNAQYEIREYAKAVGLFFETAMPITYQAFVENGHKSP